MGQSLSCLDPAREHPPYSWPKDHPDRAKAIAEIKAQRKAEKVRGIGGNARSVAKKSKDAEKSAEPVALDAESPDTSPGKVRPEGVDADVEDATAAVGVDAGAGEQAGERVAPDEPELVHVDSDEHKEGVVEKEQDVVEATPKEVVREEIKEVDAGLTDAEKLAKAEREAAAKERVERARAEAEKKRKLQPKGRLDEDLEKEEFVDAKDELPEAKEIDARVVDPVTGDLVSQEEFRQRVKTRGIITDRVSKFEQNEEKAALEKAEFEAQKEARNAFKRNKSESPGMVATVDKPESTTAPAEKAVEAVRQETVEAAVEEEVEKPEEVEAVEYESVEAVEDESLGLEDPVEEKTLSSEQVVEQSVEEAVEEKTVEVSKEMSEREAISSPVSAS